MSDYPGGKTDEMTARTKQIPCYNKLIALWRAHTATSQRLSRRSVVGKTGRLKRNKKRKSDHRERERERHYIPRVNPETSLSDPETPLIAHSLKERDKTEEEVRKEGERSRGGGGSEGSEGPL